MTHTTPRRSALTPCHHAPEPIRPITPNLWPRPQPLHPYHGVVLTLLCMLASQLTSPPQELSLKRFRYAGITRAFLYMLIEPDVG